MNTYDLGKIAVTSGGAWQDDISYEKLTCVVYDAADGGDGNAYVSLKTNIGVTPGTDPTTWQIFAQAGQSIYQLCVKHGTFVGTEAEFVEAYNNAVASANSAAENANTKAGLANSAAQNANTKAGLANTAAENAAEATRLANLAEAARAEAETARATEYAQKTAACTAATQAANEKAALANEKAALANEKAGDANAAAAAATSATEACEEVTQNVNGRVTSLEETKTRMLRDLGYNAASSIIALTLGESGKYVKCSTRAAAANADFAISAPFDVDACSELLIKTGYNPSDTDHASLDISVIAIYEEIERTRTVQKKNGSNQPLYYVTEVDPETGAIVVTEDETTTDTGYPVYIQETYTEQRYLPNNEDRYVAIPDSGYYVANIPQSCKCVISYKPGVTDMNVVVVKHGALANLTSQIFGIYEHRVMVEAVTALAKRIDALEASRDKLGSVTAGSVDSNEYTKLLAPVVLLGHGAPSASTVPSNWPDDLPWDGIPVFAGQLYVNLDAASGGLYYAIGCGAVANWIQA